MNKEPEALRLAEVAPYLEGGERGQWIVAAAAELRRLHEVNVDLLAALKTVLSESYDGPLHEDYRRQARAVIAKAEGERNEL